MLLYLTEYLAKFYSGFHVFQYLTLRGILAAVTALLMALFIGPYMIAALAKYQIGQIVRHRLYPFRGVVFDIDPIFANTEEWYQAIPVEVRPRKDQPFYHLLAENDQGSYNAYVSEQNLLPDDTGQPVGHPHTALIFESFDHGAYKQKPRINH